MMRFIFSRVFWALVLIFLGSAYLLQNILGINLKIWAIFWPALLIIFGIVLLRGNLERRSNKTYFEERKTSINSKTKEFSTLFGKTELDLTGSDLPGELELNNIFGETVVLVKNTQELAIRADSFFGQIVFPDKSDLTFGSRDYHQDGESKNSKIEMKVSNAFGQIRFTSKS